MMENLKEFEKFNEAKYTRWELHSKIEKIIDNNCKEIPYEGTEVNKPGLMEDIMELIREVAPEYRNN